MARGRTVTLGEITKPQGLKGEVRVNLSGGSVDVLEHVGRVTAVKGNASSRVLELESVRIHGRTVIVRFTGVGDRSGAEDLVGYELQVPESEIPDLGPGQYYTYELEGLEVVTESGDRLGVLEEVLDLPAHDVYLVRDERREVLLPATEEVVKKIDLANGRMVVHLLEGLLE
ncbi:MAG: 16S rRNA processing protein RimM [Candidatus Eisenbacteria sp.]|nr:16S rRNA processing protein RimM [Candidatus Eisenbacteria bacterium]